MSSAAAALPPRPWQRFLAGTISGFALVCVGHPWDTLRTLMQTSNLAGTERPSLWRLTAGLARTEGIAGFYRGFAPPFALTGAINTLLWGLQFSLVDAMEHHQLGGSPTSRAVLASIPASIIVSCIVAPIENIKTRQQTRPGPRQSAVAVLRDVLSTSGVRGMMRGQSALILRGIFGGPVYFGGNAAATEVLKHTLPPGDSAWAKSRNAMLAGGTAGVLFWFPAMPFDTIKSRMMAAPDHGPRLYAGFVDCARKLYAESGPRGFYRGFSAALLRAFPANAAAFTAADFTMRQLRALG